MPITTSPKASIKLTINFSYSVQLYFEAQRGFGFNGSTNTLCSPYE